MTLERKQERLQGILRSLKQVAVAFSAGVDSTFVLKAALDALGSENVLAATGKSRSLPDAELQSAIELAGLLGAKHVILNTDEFENPDYLRNPVNRCYYCKTTLYQHMRRYLTDRALFHVIVSGTNADDLGDYRPGLLAADEHGVRAPLAEAELSKEDIRELSRRFGLSTAEKPAGPCLSSRVPYGEEITPEKLSMIEAAEAFLKDIGFPIRRVRHHGNIARIEIPPADFARIVERQTALRIDARLRELGYVSVTVDLAGFRSGSLNDVVPLHVRSGATNPGEAPAAPYLSQ